MTRPAKTLKTRKNQPQPFHESLAAFAPSRAGLAAPALPRISSRVVLWAIWALATIAFGIGIGRLIADHNAGTAATEPGVPVAQASIQQPTSVTATSTIAQPAPATQPSLAVKPGALAVNQAGAGSPAAVLATASLQSASEPDSLQPGFQTEVRVQGQIGTQPSH